MEIKSFAVMKCAKIAGLVTAAAMWGTGRACSCLRDSSAVLRRDSARCYRHRRPRSALTPLRCFEQSPTMGFGQVRLF